MPLHQWRDGDSPPGARRVLPATGGGDRTASVWCRSGTVVCSAGTGVCHPASSAHLGTGARKERATSGNGLEVGGIARTLLGSAWVSERGTEMAGAGADQQRRIPTLHTGEGTQECRVVCLTARRLSPGAGPVPPRTAALSGGQRY